MAITKEQLQKGKILSSVTYYSGETVPFYYETGVLGAELLKIIKDSMGKYQGIEIKGIEIDMTDVMNVRDWVTGEVTYFDTDGTVTGGYLSKEAFEDMPTDELFESLMTVNEFVANYFDEVDKELETLLELEFDALWELGKRLGFRKDYK